MLTSPISTTAPPRPLDRAPVNTGTSPPTDTELVRLARAGDEEAMDDILRLHWLRVVDFVDRLTGSRDLAQDVAQEVFLGFWQGNLVWRGSGSLQAFLLGAARNVARNHGRRWREVRVDSFDGPLIPPEAHTAATPAETLREEEVETLFRSAVAALPARRREVFLLSRVHGLSHQEIAETMEISVQTVANQMSNALAELRRALAPIFEP